MKNIAIEDFNIYCIKFLADSSKDFDKGVPCSNSCKGAIWTGSDSATLPGKEGRWLSSRETLRWGQQ